MVQALKEGDPLKIRINRDEKKLTLKGKALARKVFTPENSFITLGEVPFQEGYLRYSMQKPAGDGPFPLVYYIQGYTCGSCIYVPPYHPYARTVNAFVERGYAVLKVEKPGVGDSQASTTCEHIDFTTEVAAFKAGLKAINYHDFIDEDQITVFGHSLGGLIAAQLAKDKAFASIIFYGIGFQPWQDYVLDRIQYQLPWFGADYEEIDQKLTTAKQVFHRFFNDRTRYLVITK